MSDCRIFDLMKIAEDSYKCQSCGKIHNRQEFLEILKSAPVKFCSCGGKEKKMDVYIPAPVSSYENRPIFYVCNICGGKYMYHRSRCETCGRSCDRQEIYCYDCGAENQKRKEGK